MPLKDPVAQIEYQRQWMARRRKAWFDENGPCAKCGTWEQLELDHVDPTTKVSHTIWSWSDARREAELAKCQALCHDCHQDKTAQENRERNGGRHHGGAKMYSLGCRCVPCKSNWNAKKKANRARRKALGLPHQ